MTRVSSLSRAPVRVLAPSARAATIRARLVRLFEPGTRTRAGAVGPGQGVEGDLGRIVGHRRVRGRGVESWIRSRSVGSSRERGGPRRRGRGSGIACRGRSRRRGGRGSSLGSRGPRPGLRRSPRWPSPSRGRRSRRPAEHPARSPRMPFLRALGWAWTARTVPRSWADSSIIRRPPRTGPSRPGRTSRLPRSRPRSRPTSPSRARGGPGRSRLGGGREARGAGEGRAGPRRSSVP